jgi:hypothetical protein
MPSVLPDACGYSLRRVSGLIQRTDRTLSSPRAIAFLLSLITPLDSCGKGQISAIFYGELFILKGPLTVDAATDLG